jgi:hypothetical protein
LFPSFESIEDVKKETDDNAYLKEFGCILKIEEMIDAKLKTRQIKGKIFGEDFAANFNSDIGS